MPFLTRCCLTSIFSPNLGVSGFGAAITRRLSLAFGVGDAAAAAAASAARAGKPDHTEIEMSSSVVRDKPNEKRKSRRSSASRDAGGSRRKQSTANMGGLSAILAEVCFHC